MPKLQKIEDRPVKRQRTLFEFSSLSRPSQGSDDGMNDSGGVKKKGVIESAASIPSSSSHTLSHNSTPQNSNCTPLIARRTGLTALGERSGTPPADLIVGTKNGKWKTKETTLSGVEIAWTRKFHQLYIDDADEDDEELRKQTDIDLDAPTVEEVVEKGEDSQDGQDLILQDTQPDIEPSSIHMEKGRYFRFSSMYVQEIERALDTVIQDEKHLFTTRERRIFSIWQHQSIPAKNIFVKLLLRREGWHGVGGLSDSFGVEKAEIDNAVDELCNMNWNSVPQNDDNDNNGGSDYNYGNLDDDLDFYIPIGGSDRLCFLQLSTECISTLAEATELLRVDQLRALTSRFVTNSRTLMGRDEIVIALVRATGTQSALSLDDIRPLSSTPRQVGGLETVDRRQNPKRSESLDDRLIRDIHRMQGNYVKLSEASRKLFARLLIVYYRLTGWTDEPLKTSILVRIGRQTFPKYPISRHPGVFSDRRQLLGFEASLKLKSQFSNLLDNAGNQSGHSGYSAVVALFEDLISDKAREEIEIAISSGSAEKAVEVDGDSHSRCNLDEGQSSFLRRFTPAWVYSQMMDKVCYAFGRLRMYDREHDLLTELLTQRLFHTGKRGCWYNRKALLEERYMAKTILGKDGEANKEGTASYFGVNCGGSSGMALDMIESEDGLSEVVGPCRKHDRESQADLAQMWRFQSLLTCEQGLQDPLVAPVDHFDLQRRVERLEKGLHIPIKERHNFGYAQLKIPDRRKIRGIRVIPRSINSRGDIGLLVGAKVGKEKGDGPNSNRRDGPSSAGGPTMWLDPDVYANLEDEGSILDIPTLAQDKIFPVCRVEQLCLHRFCVDEGWKGMHSESGIVRALFTLLFYDILFPDPESPSTIAIPPPPLGVFQSEYQSFPLDLYTPSFYPSRRPIIQARLTEILAGRGREIVKGIWSRYAFSCSSVVGLRWDEWDEEMVIEIVGCWPPRGLAEVCAALARDYRGVGAGVPDLFLWRVDDKICKSGVDDGDGDGDNPPHKIGTVAFVEVKSEADRLQDQRQRYWIDLLASAGITVVLCDVAAEHIIRLL